MEISNLSETVFKGIVTKMFSKSGRRLGEHTETLNKGKEHISSEEKL